MAKKLGRPPKHDETTFDKAREYIATYEATGDVIPTAAGLAAHLGVSRKTLYEWAKDLDGFRDILESLNTVQERQLLNRGLDNTFQPTIVKLVLGKHGYHDRQELGVSGKDGGDINFRVTFVDSEDSKE